MGKQKYYEWTSNESAIKCSGQCAMGRGGERQESVLQVDPCCSAGDCLSCEM